MRDILALGALFLLASSAAMAGDLAKIQSASCKRGASYLKLDIVKGTLIGRIGTLSEMSNVPEGPEERGAELELAENWPEEGTSALGTLVFDAAGIWGNLSILADSQKDLAKYEALQVLFIDQQGKSQSEILDCELRFR